MSEDDSGGSSPCFAHELIGGQPVDAETARDVSRFRQAERARLLDLRRGLSVAERKWQEAGIAEALLKVVQPDLETVLALYWPIRGEPDLRGFADDVRQAGGRVALPVVIAQNAPLEFRIWEKDAEMERGIWNIPVPRKGDVLTPDVVISPVVGIDDEGYRLGNGGGYYDRTLAAMDTMPKLIGVGHDFARIRTIYPMPWDIPMQIAILGDGDVTRFG